MKDYHRHLLGLIAFFCLGIPFPSAAIEKPTLVFPENQSVIVQKKIQVIGLAPEGVGQVTVRVRGGKALDGTEVPVAQGAFSFQVKLGRGMNTIETLGADQKVTSTLQLFQAKTAAKAPEGFALYTMHAGDDLVGDCQACHIFRRRGKPSYTRIRPDSTCSTGECHPNFDQAKFLHGPVGAKSCTGCHNPHGSQNPVFLSRTDQDLCFACHTGEESRFAGKVLHQPMQQGECLTCHDPHQSEVKFQLKGDSQEALCRSCHGGERSNHKYLHGPVGTGNCVACHNPHASDHANLLYQEKDKICFMCHQDRMEEFSRKHIHQPVLEGCGVCHDPHGSETRHQLRSDLTKRAQGQIAPCLSCHEEINPELSDQILKAKVAHHPVQEGNCTACHTPHASNYEHQLKAPLTEICYTCHMEIGQAVTESEFKHGPVLTSDCSACHKVHGYSYSRLLTNDFPTEFYTPYATEKYGICFNCHNEKVALSKWSKETQFRNGNRNLHYLHVNREKGRNCKACHEVHAGDQERHIREEIPFGSKGWSYPLSYTVNPTGGGCVVGCHRPLTYDRNEPVKY